MSKIALLIGVSEYEPGFNPLPAAVKDVEAMRRVLENSQMGDFAPENIIVLKNPQRQEMEDCIFQLFSSRDKDDLLLFYFSGHGIKDDTGRLYLSTRATRKQDGELVTPSAVAASFLHERINNSKSQRQVLILDCCFSGAIAKGLTVKDDGKVDIQTQLGGTGRAILTSSTSTQYSFAEESSELSVYTRYLVEGIEKGVADKDGDGWITVDELHDYASGKVKQVSPAMTPKFYPVEEGFRIKLAKSPKDDPQLKYRKEVQRRINKGNFTIPGRRLLNSMRVQLGLTAEVADAIEAEVKQPYLEYQRKLQEYEETLVEAIQAESTLSETTLNDLRDYQQHLNLTDEDVASIEQRILGKQKDLVVEEVRSLSESSTARSPQGNSTLLSGSQPLNTFEFEVITVNAQGKLSDKRPGKAEFFTEDLGDGVLLEMVAIPGGQFVMGSPDNELERFDNESPQHTVTIQPFFMGKFPIIQSQWAKIAVQPKVNIDLKPDPSNFKGGNRPVECVSWDDAIEFCARLAKLTGKGYRLPSEAEWEYACRAGTNTPFYFGETITTDLANYRGTDWTFEKTVYNGNYGQGPKGIYREETTEVGKFPPNACGLYDMHGNVWEWCQDTWHENYQGVPSDGTAWVSDNNDNSQFQLLRDGSCFLNPRGCRSACRFRFARYNSHTDVGFRVVVVGAARTL